MNIENEEIQDYKDLLNSIGKLIELQNQTINQNLPIYESKITEIVNKKITDNNIIEHLLDSLLDVAFHDDILILFKKLCRYYYYINPSAVVSYINSYREMWDEESELNEEG